MLKPKQKRKKFPNDVKEEATNQQINLGKTIGAGFEYRLEIPARFVLGF